MFKTLLIGGLVGFITSVIVSWHLVAEYLSPFNGFELMGVALYFIGYALTFSVVSLAGFLAYLFVHRFGENIVRSFWPIVQIVIIAFVLFDIVYFSNKNIALLHRVIIMLAVLLFGVLVAIVKVRQTNRTAIIPAMFFMIVITTLELTLGLRTDDMYFIIPMLVTLIVTNAYQIIAWYHVTKRDEAHMKRIAERRRQRQLEREKLAKKEQKKKEQTSEETKDRKKQKRGKGKKR